MHDVNFLPLLGMTASCDGDGEMSVSFSFVPKLVSVSGLIDGLAPEK